MGDELDEEDVGALNVLMKIPKKSTKKKKKKKKEPEYIDFNIYAEKLPVGKSAEDKKKRKEMFESMDQSCNNSLSLAEIELGLKSYVGEEVFLMKPAVKMAYKVAREHDKTDSKFEKGFVDKGEFRILLVSVRRFIELYAAFDTLDSSNDNRIDLDEFKAGVAHMKNWGVEVTDPVAEFKTVDHDGGGKILFNEFCHWALNKGLDYDQDMDEDELDEENVGSLNVLMKIPKKSTK